MNIEYGDIVCMDLNPVKGAEIAKARPCLVVSRTSINISSRFVIVVPLTSNVKKSMPYHLMVKPSRWNGLTLDSKVLTEQIRSLDKTRLVKKIGSLEPLLLKQLEERLLFILNQGEEFLKVKLFVSL